MKKSFIPIALFASFLLITSCENEKPTAASVAATWCDLNGKAYKAAEGPDKEAAIAARKKYETEMEAKYKDDKAFMDQVEVEVEKCEDASEGR